MPGDSALRQNHDELWIIQKSFLITVAANGKTTLIISFNKSLQDALSPGIQFVWDKAKPLRGYPKVC